MSHASSTIQISFLWGSGTDFQGNRRPDIADDRQWMQWSDPTSDPSSYQSTFHVVGVVSKSDSHTCIGSDVEMRMGACSDSRYTDGARII